MKLPVNPLPDAVPRPIDHLALSGAGDATALVLADRIITYAQLNQRIGQLAAWLASRAVPGDRIASWLPKGEAACLLPLATARAGLVHVPVNPVLKRGQVAHILSDSGATLLIANAARLEALAGDDTGECCCCDAQDIVTQMDAWVPLPPSQAAAGDLVALMYTSGSTGRAKGVMLSHANLWLGAVSVASFLGLASDDRVLAVLPLAFDYGQNQLLSAWFAGACVIPHDYLLPRDVLRAASRHGATTLAGVPPLWRQLAALDQGMWPGTLRRMTNSGGALDEPLVRRLRALAPAARLFAMYGLTEAFRSTALDPDLVDAHPTAIGDAVPFAEVMVVRDDGMPAEVEQEGELVHAGPLVAMGYWRDPARTAERFRAAPAWSQIGGIAVWSGDRVRRDAAGLLYFAGRRDAMIKTAGTRVSPQEIEDAAFATGLVRDAVALGLPDADLGQAVHLVACAAQCGAGGELIAAMARDLPGFMVPRVVHWRDALPLNPNGKVDRAALYQELSDLADKAAS